MPETKPNLPTPEVSDVQMIACENRAQWLTERRKSVGGSEMAAIIGHNQYRSAYSVWADKVGLTELDSEQSEPVYWGLKFEDDIAEEYAKRTGREIWDPGSFTLYRSRVVPAHATPDRLLWDKSAGSLSVKYSGLTRRWDDLPLDAQIQLQHELTILGFGWGAVAVLVATRFHHTPDIKRHEAFSDFLKMKVDEFWQYVEKEEPPPVDPSGSTKETLSKIFPRQASDDKVVRLPAAATGWAEEWDNIGIDLTRLFEKKDLLANRIMQTLGDAAMGLLPDGSGWSWKHQKRKSYQVKETEFRKLRRVGANKKGA